MEALFEQAGQKSVITVSFLEIYNEQVKDLLWTAATEGQNL